MSQGVAPQGSFPITVLGLPVPGDVPTVQDSGQIEWQSGSLPASTAIATMTGTIQDSLSPEPTTAQQTATLDGVAATGTFVFAVPVLTAVVAAMGTVLTVADGMVLITGLPPSTNEYGITFQAVLANAAGTATATLSGSVAVAPETASGQVNLTDVTLTNNAGADLAYDNGTGIVSSTAGGTFSGVVIIGGGYL